MAEGINLVEKSLEDLEREVTCAICQDHYTEPKVLPCCHYYCKQCILKLALRTCTGEPFLCPECRKEATLPEGGVDQLTTAFFINRLKSTFTTLERAHGKVEVKCEACTDSGAKGEAFCRQCAVFVCKECVMSHQRLKAYHEHKVVSLEELKQGGAKEIVVKEPLGKKCLVHEEPLIIYCFDCDSLICRDCTVKDHRDHNFEFSKVAAPDTKKKLDEKLEPLRKVEVSLSHVVEKILTTKRELEAQGNSVANAIETSFEELHVILEMRKRELLKEAGRIVQKKVDKLSLQEKNLSLASAEVQSVVDYTEQCVRHCADNEVMSMHAEIRSRIEREIEEHSKPVSIMEPVEEVDIGVEVMCAEALQQLFQTKAKITYLPIDPSKCTVTIEAAEVSKKCEATLIVRLSSNKPTKRSCIVDSHLKSLTSGSIIKCSVDRTVAGSYSIHCTPTVRGQHELTVSVDGQQIAGSPFPVFVSIPPTQLGKPVKVWRDIPEPIGIAVNSVGEIIVAERLGNIVTFDREGKRLRCVKRSEHKLDYVCGVAVDGEDNIYCTDYKSNKIFRCNKDGGNIQVHEVEQMKGRGHRGVAVVGDEVMVCECDNEGSAAVYNKELKYCRLFNGQDTREFHYLSPDSHGNLYVANCRNACIRVFSNSGDLLHSFSCDRNGVKKNTPHFLCVAGQYVYVTNYSSYDMSVYTTEGEYVTSLHDLWCPHGVCVDKDGFLYISDTCNDRIQVF